MSSLLIIIIIEYGQQKLVTQRPEIRAITLFIMIKRLEKSAVLSNIQKLGSQRNCNQRR
jgi:hypothetical protein